MELDYFFVDFEKYCETCKHKDLDDAEEPCNECLECPVNLHSQKPVKWEESNDLSRLW